MASKVKSQNISVSTHEYFKTLITEFNKDDELELSFMPKVSHISLNKYITLLEFFSASGLPVEVSYTLNTSFSYNYDTLSSYRITVAELDNINDVIPPMTTRDNHIIFSLLLLKIKKSLEKDKQSSETLFIIDKQKTKENIADINELGIRLRKSKEILLDKTKIDDIFPNFEDRKYINFRYIQRTSIIIEKTAEYIIRVDLSYVQTSNKITTLLQTNPKIELEIDITALKNINTSQKTKIGSVLDTTYRNLLRVLQKSNVILNLSDQSDIINKMFSTLFPSKQPGIKDLPGMQSQSAELQHVVDYINHEYSVTDKADGERHFMFICENRIFLISNNLEVKEIETVPGVEEWNNSIFDGEYLFIEEKQKFLFLIFDCLVQKGTDIRTKNLLIRLQAGRDCSKEIFEQGYFANKYTGSFDLEAIKQYYTDDMVSYIHDVNSRLETSKCSNVIAVKYFAFPQGIKRWEIFFLTSLMYNIYTTANKHTHNKKSVIVKCPYTLDGCMWTPVEQEYVRSLQAMQKKIYKFKPRKYNSLDLYVEFIKDPITGANINVFDDAEANSQYIDKLEGEIDESVEIKVKGQIYQILKLHVGKVVGNSEFPILFHEDQDHHLAYVPIVNGAPRDTEGNIIQDKTVVEFTYKNENSIKAGNKWIPLRTRYDKTDSVIQTKRKYGNNSVIAEKIWRSMMDGIELSDIELLGNPTTFEKHHEKLKSHITTNMIESEKRENAYYNIVSDLAKPLREFHNWLKSNLIASYCGEKYVRGKRENLDVLDYGIGRGGDLGKYLHARIGTLTGFDSDYFGIYSATDSAISRYHTLKKQKGVIQFDMTFLVADGGALLTVKDQKLSGIEMSDINTRTLKQIFDNDNPPLYDVVSCQFAVHYFFKNDQTLQNFMINISRFTKPSAYVIITTFDMDIVNKHLTQEGGMPTSYYTTKEGVKEVVFDVIKKYEGDAKNITGQVIDVHLPSFDKDKYVMEYLVPKKLLIDKMEEFGFALIETDLFWNVFNKHKNFFMNASSFEEGQTKSFYQKVKEFYNQDDPMNQATYHFTQKNRYFVFQKHDDGENPRTSNTRQKQTPFYNNDKKYNGDKKFDNNKKYNGDKKYDNDKKGKNSKIFKKK